MRGGGEEPCAGFDENVVLAVKACFLDSEIRCLIIVRSSSSKYIYHSRTCPSLSRSGGVKRPPAAAPRQASDACNRWFSTLVGSADTKQLSPGSVENLVEEEHVGIALEDENHPSPHQHDNQECAERLARLRPAEKFCCEFCGKKFRMRPSLNKHKERSHTTELKISKLLRSGEHACAYCGLRFDKKASMQRHVSRKHASECELENRLKADDDNIVEYFRAAEHVPADPLAMMPADVVATSPTDADVGPELRQPQRCPVEGCGKELPSRSQLRAHIRQVHNSGQPRRGRRPREPPDLELAAKLGLGPDLKDSPYEQAQACEFCPKQFETKLKMYWHLRKIHQQARKPCHLCGLMVKKLSDHVKRQHMEKDVKKFVCELCGTRFKGQSGYQFHLAGHTGEKRFLCRTCGKNYRTSSESYNCERAHQNIYRWRCSHCSFRSHQRNKFIRHLRTHTKSQPYTCPMCEHTAARKDYLQKHVLKVHTSNGTSLEELEKLYPTMYTIEEKIQLIAPISYEKMDLAGMGSSSMVGTDQQQQSYGATQQHGDEEVQQFRMEESVQTVSVHQLVAMRESDLENTRLAGAQQNIFYLRRDLPGEELSGHRTVVLHHREESGTSSNPGGHEAARMYYLPSK